MKKFSSLKTALDFLEKVLIGKPNFYKKHSYQLKKNNLTVVNDTLIVVEEEY